MRVEIGGCEDSGSFFEEIIKIGSIIILGFILKNVVKPHIGDRNARRKNLVNGEVYS